MNEAGQALAQEVAALKAALASAEAKGLQAAAELAVARAKASEDTALIAAQKLRIAKLERQVYGQRSERSARLIEQLSLEFEELAAGATQDELAAEMAVAKTSNVRAFTRRPSERSTFPDHLPRERVVIDPPTACECCGGSRLRKLGEDVTRTMESEPRRWKVVETVREKFTCRDCEKISQAPAPFHSIPRAWAGPSLLAMIVFEKFGQHQPLNRQAERYALEGAPIALSTMADAVGAVCATLDPMRALLEAHVMAAERLHGDDTTVPVQAQGKTVTGRLWTYVRDDKPFGGVGPPAAIFYYSRDRRGEHPQAHLAGYSGILQADAYDGYNALYLLSRKPGPIQEAACWAHARRKFFEFADVEGNLRRKAAGKKEIALSPIAIEVVRRIDAVFEIERAVNGKSAKERLAARRTASREPASGRRSSRLLARATHKALARARSGQGDQLHAEALAGVLAVPRRRAGLPLQQRSGAGAARGRTRKKVVAVLWLRSRRSARRRHVQPHRDGQNERRRSAGLARRRAQAHRRPSCAPPGRIAALELEQDDRDPCASRLSQTPHSPKPRRPASPQRANT